MVYISLIYSTGSAFEKESRWKSLLMRINSHDWNAEADNHAAMVRALSYLGRSFVRCLLTVCESSSREFLPRSRDVYFVLTGHESVRQVLRDL